MVEDQKTTTETTNARLLARLVRSLLAAEKFETLADLTDALKFRCAKLKIRWTPDDFTDAFRIIESNTPLVGTPVRKLWNVEHIERPDDAAPLSRDEAGDIWRRLLAALERQQQRPAV